MQNNSHLNELSGFVVSDLHIFTEWTSVESYMHKISHAAASANFFVLNGDIFDFKWSTLKTSNETASQAINWLLQICKNAPNCKFYYVLGNHDAHIKMPPLLRKLTHNLNNFNWSPTHFFLGSHLFLHGDLLLTLKKTSPFNRPNEKYLKAEPKHRMLSKGYNIAIGMGAHKLVTNMIKTHKCAAYSYKVLNKYPLPDMKFVSDVFIGHTHVAFSNYKYKNLVFHNTGSAVADLHCNIINLNIRE